MAMNIHENNSVRSYLQELRNQRTELEEEIELWQDQIALTDHQMQQDDYDRVNSSKHTKRHRRNAQDNLRQCQHRLMLLKNEVISYTAKRLALVDLQQLGDG